MLDPLFSEAFIHAPRGHTILGRSLHPLCALDFLALEAINSPFLLDGSKAEISDLLLAIWILSNPHPRDCTIDHLELDDAGKAWVDSLAGQIDMERDCALVVTYFEDYWSLPEMMRTIADQAMTPYGCPWMLSRVISASRVLHIPIFDAWTMGIGQLLWYCCAIEEMDSNDSRIVSTDMRKLLDAAKSAFSLTHRKDDETHEQFAERLGLSADTLKVLLRNSTKS